MTINISGKVDEEMFNKFITFFNENLQNQKIIYFSSSGGSTDIAEACIDLINSNKQNTTLIAYNKLYSSGFDIFFKSKCNRHILENSIGMYHQRHLDVSVNENIKPIWKEDKCKIAFQKIQKIKTIEFCKNLNFSINNLKLIKKGNDVWFQNIELQKMLKHSDSPNV